MMRSPSKFSQQQAQAGMGDSAPEKQALRPVASNMRIFESPHKQRLRPISPVSPHRMLTRTHTYARACVCNLYFFIGRIGLIGRSLISSHSELLNYGI